MLALAKEPICSVVTVNYNNGPGLERTLRSVDAQTLEALESVVIDGGSSDESQHVMEARTTSKPTVHVSERDEGIYDAMNKGWRKATGALIIFMNSGDSFASLDIVGRIASDWQSRRWRWGYGCGRVVASDGTPTAILHRVPFSREKLALGYVTVPHQAVFMERSLLHELGGFDLAVGLAADQDLLARAASLAQPATWAEFVVNFEGGGAGSNRQFWEFPREMRLARRSRGEPLGGSWVRDSALTTLVLLSRGVTHGQGKLRRRLRRTMA